MLSRQIVSLTALLAYLGSITAKTVTKPLPNVSNNTMTIFKRDTTSTDTAPTSTSSITDDVPANAFRVIIPEYCYAQALTGGWGGYGFRGFDFMFNDNYLQEGFFINMYPEYPGDWTTASPTKQVTCTAGASASPTASTVVEAIVDLAHQQISPIWLSKDSQSYLKCE